MKRLVLILCVALFLLPACRSGKSVSGKYYLLEPDRDQSFQLAGDQLPLPYSCYLSPVWVHPAFASHQIALRSNTHEISYFAFNEWGMRPGQALTELLESYFVREGLFVHVTTAEAIPAADLRLETRVARLEVERTGNSFVANLDLEFSLFDKDRNLVINVWEKQARRELEERNLNLFAAAVSSLFAEALHEFSEELLRTLAKE